jgi:hypothetical protein
MTTIHFGVEEDEEAQLLAVWWLCPSGERRRHPRLGRWPCGVWGTDRPGKNGGLKGREGQADFRWAKRLITIGPMGGGGSIQWSMLLRRCGAKRKGASVEADCWAYRSGLSRIGPWLNQHCWAWFQKMGKKRWAHAELWTGEMSFGPKLKME